MTLDGFIRSRFGKYVSALKRLASRHADDASKRAIENVVMHLRALYQERKTAFTEFDIDQIRKHSLPTTIDESVSLEKGEVAGESGAFIVGKKYLSDHGIYEIVAVTPFPVIEPAVYPACTTPYFAEYMLDEHNRIQKELSNEISVDDNLVNQFLSSFPSASEEIAEWIVQYHGEIVEKHRTFLQELNIEYRGIIDGTKIPRQTHCYICKSDLDSELFKECCTCSWIVCFCGACGCGYDREKFDA